MSEGSWRNAKYESRAMVMNSNQAFPVDIVKVRLQTTSQYSSALDGATQIFKNEGPLAFYKV